MSVANLVDHLFVLLLFSRLRQEYMDYVENYLYHDSAVPHHNFLTSFLTHCLPFLDAETDPALVHLVSSLVSHTTGLTPLQTGAEDVKDVTSPRRPSTDGNLSRCSTDTRLNKQTLHFIAIVECT